MPSYSVEIDGETVWSGDGDDYKVIPAEYRDRPANAVDGEPHPSPHVLIEDDEIIGVQVSLAHEDDLENDAHPATWAALTEKGA